MIRAEVLNLLIQHALVLFFFQIVILQCCLILLVSFLTFDSTLDLVETRYVKFINSQQLLVQILNQLLDFFLLRMCLNLLIKLFCDLLALLYEGIAFLTQFYLCLFECGEVLEIFQ